MLIKKIWNKQENKEGKIYHLLRYYEDNKPQDLTSFKIFLLA